MYDLYSFRGVAVHHFQSIHVHPAWYVESPPGQTHCQYFSSTNAQPSKKHIEKTQSMCLGGVVGEEA